MKAVILAVGYEYVKVPFEILPYLKDFQRLEREYESGKYRFELAKGQDFEVTIVEEPAGGFARKDPEPVPMPSPDTVPEAPKESYET